MRSRAKSAASTRPGLEQQTLGTRHDSRSFPSTDYRIRRALEIMERDYSQHLSATQLAAAVNLSRSRFEHLFKAVTGRRFKPTLREIRLARARALLADRGLSVKEVAGRVGFATMAALSRAFAQRFGLPPSEWRRSTLEKQVARSDNK